MSMKKVDAKILDEILEQMIDTVVRSKDDIFQIGEQCRKDYESVSEELNEIREQVATIIREGDELEIKSRFSRRRLAEVSQHFQNHSEEEVRQAYEKAHELQMSLTMNRQLEKQFRYRRDELERRLVAVQETIERAEQLVSQVSVVMNYLIKRSQTSGCDA